jgi:ribose transport system substrate-binding protein
VQTTESSAAPSRVPAVHRAARVLRAVAATDHPVALTELARSLGLPKSSLLGICQALAEERLLVRDGDGRYRLGLRVAELASVARATASTVRHVGMTVQHLGNPFFLAEISAARATVAAELSASVTALDAEQDPERQSAQIRELVRDGAEVILVDPVDSDALEPALEQAHAAGVPVVAINGGAAGADATVTTDNTQAGHLVARRLAEHLGRRGRLAIVDGTSVTAIADRVAGFLNALRDYPEVEVVAHEHGDNTTGRGRDIALEIFDSTPGLDGFFGINDPTSEGIAAAARERGRQVAIVSVDGSSAAVASILAGGPIIATAAQDPGALARTGLRLALQLRAGARPSERSLLLPTRLIGPAEAEGYEPWG